MLQIILCDDDHFTLRLTSGLLNQAISAGRTDARIVCLASSGAELLAFIRRNAGSYLYFLDFDLGKTELNGIDLVKKIYEIDPAGEIVFVTSHTDKGMDILKSGIRALGFMEKTPDQKKMIEEYRNYLALAAPSAPKQSETPCLTLPLGIDEAVQLPIPEIAYVDSVKTVAHSICYHTFYGSEITVRDTIEHAAEQLGADFLRCHRSVLVNKKHVVSLKNGLLKLSNGMEVTCAIGKRKEILAACLNKEDSL